MPEPARITSLVLGAAIACGAVAGPASGDHDVLNIVSWGGSYTASQMRAYIDPFRRDVDPSAEVERYDGGLEEVRAQVVARNIEWDVIDLGLSDAVRGCEEGLLAPIDHSMLPAGSNGESIEEDFLPGMLPECAVGQNVFSNVIATNTEIWGERDAPATVEDFFDTDRFPGRRGMRRNPRGNLELALMADGVPADEVYQVLSTEEGIERAFDKLNEIAPRIVWWQGAEAPQALLEKRQVAMTTAYNGRAQSAIDNDGLPFRIIWDGQIWDYELWAVVKGSPKRAEAMEFIRFASDPARQAEQTHHIAYGPARKSAMALVEGSVKETLPTADANMENALRTNHEWWAEHQARLDKRFDRFIEAAQSQAGTSTLGVGTAR